MAAYRVSQTRRLRFLAALLAAFLCTIVILKHNRVREAPQTVRQKSGSHKPNGQLEQKAFDHPIRQLHEQAIADFDSLVKRQSTTLEDAVMEYKRRYGRPPPFGFDKWFKFAIHHKSVIIDEFDMISESLEPLWRMSPQAVKGSYKGARDGPSVETLSVRNGKASVSKNNEMGENVVLILGDTWSDIPDFDILMNNLDEPRVLLSKSSGTVGWNDASSQPSWATVSEPCKYRAASQSHSKPFKPSVDTHGIPFVTDLRRARDICQNPDFKHQHGFLISPSSFITTNLPVPIMSQTRLSTFSDIIYPSMWYWTNAVWEYDALDPSWANKTATLYWAGSTTGGGFMEHARTAHVESHRHRFNRLSNALSPEPHLFLAHTPQKGWSRYASNDVPAALYDVKFTATVQCDTASCQAQRGRYRFGAREPPTKPLGSRLVMDLDGNSFSGRFYTLLKSGSCPLKMTVFREWHDERLVPWLHYVPISVGMEELHETVRYLSLTREGSEVAREVARRGSEWHDRVLRQEDAAVYLYRLFLEYARVTHDGRDKGEMDLKGVDKA